MAGKPAVIRWGGHRVLQPSVVQPRVSWLKEASRGRLTRRSRKAEHRAHVTHPFFCSHSLYLVYTNHSMRTHPKQNKKPSVLIASNIKSNMDNSYVWLVMSTSESVMP